MIWGIIGAGDIVRKRVASAIQATPGAQLKGITRRDSSRLADVARELGIPTVYPDAEALYADSEIDAVYIATPVHTHKTLTVAAAAAGKQVLCEKPIAIDAASADRMIRTCAEAGVTLGVAYYRHFYPVIARIREILSSGLVGTPVQARIDAFETFDPPPNHPRAWLLNPAKSGGGPMIDFGCHRIEVLTSLFPPTEEPGTDNVNAFLETSVHSREVEDNAVAIFRLVGGVIGTVAVSHSIGVARDTMTIWASGGVLHCPELNSGRLEITITSNGSSRSTVEEHPPHPNLHFPLIEDFERAVALGERPAVDGETGRLVTAYLDQIYHRRA